MVAGPGAKTPAVPGIRGQGSSESWKQSNNGSKFMCVSSICAYTDEDGYRTRKI